jgi:tetratricopeptide (TPR) repeat protein
MRTTLFAEAAAVLLTASICTIAGCKNEPTPAEQHLLKGNDLYKSQDFAGAAAELDESLKLDPKQDQKVWEKCAFSYGKAGKTDEAVGILMRELPLLPTLPQKQENLRNAAGMYLQAGQGDKAEKVFGDAVKVDPKDEFSLGWMAEIASQRGGARKNDGGISVPDLEVALARYDQLLAINPNSMAYLVNKRIVLARMMKGLDDDKKSSDKPTIAKLQARIDELKKLYDVTNEKMAEVGKALKAAKEAAAAGASGSTATASAPK